MGERDGDDGGGCGGGLLHMCVRRGRDGNVVGVTDTRLMPPLIRR